MTLNQQPKTANLEVSEKLVNSDVSDRQVVVRLKSMRCGVVARLKA